MKHLFYLPTACLAMMLGAATFVSCGSDDDDDDNAPSSSVTAGKDDNASSTSVTPGIQISAQQLIGTWRYTDEEDGEYEEFEFKSNGTGNAKCYSKSGQLLDFATITWTISGNRLTVYYDEDDPEDYDTVIITSISSNSFTVKEGSEAYTYYRM